MLSRLRRWPAFTLYDRTLLKIGSGMMVTSPVTSAGASVSDLIAKLFKVIAENPLCQRRCCGPPGGNRPPPGLHELIENPVQIIVTEAVTQKLITMNRASNKLIVVILE